MQRKTVFLNDRPIGQASTWAEVDALFRENGILFTARPGRAEGPTGFFVHGTRAAKDPAQLRSARGDTDTKT